MYLHVFKFNSNHDKSNGRFSSAAGGSGGEKVEHLAHLNELVKLLHTKGGFSYNPVKDTIPKEGLILSIHPEHSVVKDLATFKAKDIADYFHAKRAMFKDPKNHIGGWVSEGKVFLDVSTIVKDAATAERLCKKHDQIAYFDLGTGKEIIVNKNATSGGIVNTKNSLTVKKSSKPAVSLLSGNEVTVDTILRMYETMTGKKATDVDRAEVEASFAANKTKD